MDKSIAAPSAEPKQQLLHTPNSACRALDISRTKLYALMREGVLRYVLIGSDRRIPHSELERLAAEGAPAEQA